MSEAGAVGGEAGGEATPFHQTLDASFHDNASLAKFKDVNALAGSYVALEKRMGERPDANAIQFPTTVDAKGIAPIMERLGRPAELGDGGAYAFDRVEGAPDTYNPGGAFAKKMTELAHKHGIPPVQAKAMLHEVAQLQAGVAQQRAQQQQINDHRAQQVLQEAWGQNFDAKLKAAEYAVTKLGIEDVSTQRGLNKDPRLMVAFAQMGELMAEDETLGIRGGKSTFGGGPDAAALTAQAQKLEMDSWGGTVSPEQRAKMQEEAMALRKQASMM